jgi:hypothetical protein
MSAGLLGNSIPGDWRPFSTSSPWNQIIVSGAANDVDNSAIIAHMLTKASKVRLSNTYNSPLWVVDSQIMSYKNITANASGRIWEGWDSDHDDVSDYGCPLASDMWGENTPDGHIIVIDPTGSANEFGSNGEACWEISKYNWNNGSPTCGTFNIWSVSAAAEGFGATDFYMYGWTSRGGRGSGVPIIAGMVRPEEVEMGEIRHALAFTFSECRGTAGGYDIMLWPPACRSDGGGSGQSTWIAAKYPIQGMRIQLDPTLTESDFISSGLNIHARVLARALQKYGAYLVDIGGDLAFQVQCLNPDPAIHKQLWDQRLPGLYDTFKLLPINKFRVVDRDLQGVVYTEPSDAV